MNDTRRVLSAILVMSALLAASRSGAAVTLERAEVGVAGLLRAGDWARFKLTMTADADGFEGTVSCDLGQGQIRRPLSMPPFGVETWEAAAVVSPFAVEGTVRWTDGNGRESEAQFDVAPSVADGDVAVLALTTDRGLLTRIVEQPVADWLPAAKHLSGRFVVRETGSVRSLPRDWVGWSGVDIVVWSGVDPHARTWTPARRQALLRWIAHGGTLICADDGVMEGWKSSFIGPFVPYDPQQRVIEPFGPKRTSLPVYAGRNLGGSARSLVRAGSGAGPTAVAVWRQSDPCDLGAVIWVGVPFRALARHYLEDDIWREILRSVDPSPLRSLELATPGQHERLLTRLDRVDGEGVSERTRRIAAGAIVWLAAVALLAFLVARRRLRTAWLVLVIAAMVAAAVPVLLRDRKPSAATREAGVIRVLPGLGEAYWHGIVSVPPMAETSVSVPFWTDPHVMPLTRPSGSAWLAHPDDADVAGELVEVRPDPYRWRHWQGIALVPFAGQLRLGDQHRDSANAYRVVNNTAWTFERAAVLAGTRAGFVDDVRAGDVTAVPMLESPRRRSFWSELGVPAPVYGYWSREGLLDALVDESGTYFLGWLRGVSVVSPKESASPDDLLLVIAPVDIKGWWYTGRAD